MLQIAGATQWLEPLRPAPVNLTVDGSDDDPVVRIPREHGDIDIRQTVLGTVLADDTSRVGSQTLRASEPKHAAARFRDGPHLRRDLGF